MKARSIATSSNHVIKDLSQLGKIFEKPATPAPTTVATVIQGMFDPPTMEDSTSLAIWKVMSDYKGRTSKEIAERLRNVEIELAEVVDSLKWLTNIGWFDRTQAGQDTIYTLKKGVAKPAAETPVIKPQATKMFRAPQDIGSPNPHGVIDKNEDLDISIWKAMCDRKARTATEIGEICAAFGIDRDQAKDRAITLMRRGWFTRQERHEVTYYVMKKGIKMPSSKKNTPQVTGPAAKMETQPSTTPAQKPTRVLSIPGKARVIQQVPAAPAKPALSAPKASDGVATCIWKVMSDYKQYGRSDVGLLLEEVGINPDTVRIKMTQLDREGWFDTVKNPHGRGVLFTLRKGIAMPVGEAPYLAAKPRTFSRTTPNAVTPSITPKEESMPIVANKTPVSPATPTPAPMAAATRTPPAPAPLVEVCIKLKGDTFTFAQAHEIASVLKQNGYDDAVGKMHGSTLVDTSISIAGKAYTHDEAFQVLAELTKAGFGHK